MISMVCLLARFRHFSLVTLLLAIAALPFPCAAEIDAGVSFTPNGLPISLGWSLRGGLSVSASSPAIVTPLGVLHTHLSLSQAKALYPTLNLLVVVLGKDSYVYDLHGGRFVLELPDNQKGSVTVEYDGDSIFVRVPDPALLGPPRRIDPRAEERSPTLIEGRFSLRVNSGFSFGTKSVTPFLNSDLALAPARCQFCSTPTTVALWARGLRDLGPLQIASIRRVRGYEEVTLLGMAVSALSFKQVEYLERSYERALLATVGHVYEVATGQKGSPYALVKLLRVTGSVSDQSAKGDFEYRFQSDGSRNF